MNFLSLYFKIRFSDIILLIGTNNCDTDDDNSDLDEAFFSPANSLPSSDDEWELADEGPDLFIYE